ncbi:MAG: crossover junction endodeoxyribonuclease RuvC, partial [Armatimonadetes bacterium]|nr:crossover junction endodeoxyribonuclease RuvC [Armatimonadota bacterium]
MIVLVIDPGLAATGYGVVRKTGNNFECLDYGCVTTKPSEETPARLQVLYEAISSVIDRWNPALVVM